MAGIPDTRHKGNSLESVERALNRPKVKDAQPSSESRPVRQASRPRSGSVSGSPYGSWLMVRLGYAAISILAALIILAFFTGSFFVSLFITIVLSVQIFRSDKWEGRADIFEAIDGWLADRLPPRECPECRQSIFDTSEDGGYAAEAETSSFFPARNCRNCGFDLTKEVNSP